jgi:AraC family transcriptional regulator
VSPPPPEPPEGMDIVIVPAFDWAVFAHLDHIGSLPKTYAAIFREWLPQSGRVQAEAPVLEQHAKTFDARTGEGGIYIWVPLKA